MSRAASTSAARTPIAQSLATSAAHIPMCFARRSSAAMLAAALRCVATATDKSAW
jgi:hypothetical protein